MVAEMVDVQSEDGGDDERDSALGTGRVGRSHRHQLSRRHTPVTPLYIYKFFQSSGERMVSFAVGLYLVHVSHGSLQLVAVYALLCTVCLIFLTTLIAEWVDNHPRLTVARISIVTQNLAILSCALTVYLSLAYSGPIGSLGGGHVTRVCHAVVIVTAVMSRIGGVMSKTSVEKDWVRVVCGDSTQQIAAVNATLHAVDLACTLLFPILVAQLITYVSMETAAMFIGAWTIVALTSEFALVCRVYYAWPNLFVMSKQDVECLPMSLDTQTSMIVYELPPPSPLRLLFARFVCVYRGWRVYYRQSVFTAGLAYLAQFTTVLSLDSVTSGYVFRNGVSASILGILVSVAALVGLLATYVFPVLLGRFGLHKVGLIGVVSSLVCLSLCVVSVWVEGSPYGGRHAQYYHSDFFADVKPCYDTPAITSVDERFGLRNASRNVTDHGRSLLREPMNSVVTGGARNTSKTTSSIGNVLLQSAPRNKSHGGDDGSTHRESNYTRTLGVRMFPNDLHASRPSRSPNNGSDSNQKRRPQHDLLSTQHSTSHNSTSATPIETVSLRPASRLSASFTSHAAINTTVSTATRGSATGSYMSNRRSENSVNPKLISNSTTRRGVKGKSNGNDASSVSKSVHVSTRMETDRVIVTPYVAGHRLTTDLRINNATDTVTHIRGTRTDILNARTGLQSSKTNVLKSGTYTFNSRTDVLKSLSDVLTSGTSLPSKTDVINFSTDALPAGASTRSLNTSVLFKTTNSIHSRVDKSDSTFSMVALIATPEVAITSSVTTEVMGAPVTGSTNAIGHPVSSTPGRHVADTNFQNDLHENAGKHQSSKVIITRRRVDFTRNSRALLMGTKTSGTTRIVQMRSTGVSGSVARAKPNVTMTDHATVSDNSVTGQRGSTVVNKNLTGRIESKASTTASLVKTTHFQARFTNDSQFHESNTTVKTVTKAILMTTINSSNSTMAKRNQMTTTSPTTSTQTTPATSKTISPPITFIKTMTTTTPKTSTTTSPITSTKTMPTTTPKTSTTTSPITSTKTMTTTTPKTSTTTSPITSTKTMPTTTPKTSTTTSPITSTKTMTTTTPKTSTTTSPITSTKTMTTTTPKTSTTTSPITSTKTMTTATSPKTSTTTSMTYTTTATTSPTTSPTTTKPPTKTTPPPATTSTTSTTTTTTVTTTTISHSPDDVKTQPRTSTLSLPVERHANTTQATPRASTLCAPAPLLSIILFLVGIVSSRFGVWTTDLTVTRIFHETVPESDRSTVNAVHHSLAVFLETARFAALVCAPHIDTFPAFILASFGLACLGTVLYSVHYVRQVRGYLCGNTLLCVGQRGMRRSDTFDMLEVGTRILNGTPVTEL